MVSIHNRIYNVLMINNNRIRPLNRYDFKFKGPVVYWMNREQRVDDNWALLYAQQIANDKKIPLIVVHNLVGNYLGGGARQFDFKTGGLIECEKALNEKDIPFYLFNKDDGIVEINSFIKDTNACAVVTDFNPLKISNSWLNRVQEKNSLPFFQVDAHNIVPCWFTSNKKEFAARTIRPKINKLLKDFIDDYPKLQKQKYKWDRNIKEIKWDKLRRDIEFENKVMPVTWIQGGSKYAQKTLKSFIEQRLDNYSEARNDPSKDFQSELSPYLHYGHISAQRVVIELMKSDSDKKNRNSFFEELIVRRELSDNFCFYNSEYDSIKGFPDWAKKTLIEHKKDKRDYIYSKDELEQANTHDEVWNASQRQMLSTGKMHGYMRMYWAKKILEWSKDVETALANAIYLNDKYELDGRDPNGYVGIAWSIGGVHDRAWSERDVFGKIRYMGEKGIRSKFNIEEYLDKYR